MGALKKYHNVSSLADSIDRRAGRGQYSLGGFIFVCNTQTIPDLERRIFGLPAGYADKVRGIRKGMPLFLFNCTNRFLYGIFEAASDGGFNIDPYAWENTDLSLKGGRPVSRYPAQVRVRIREERLPLDEEIFSFVLEYVDKHRFKHDLTVKQVQQLLRLFGSQTPERELPLGRNGRNAHIPAINSRDPESPRSTYKSDSDYYSDSSGRGVNSCEDDWSDETQGHYPHQSEEGMVVKRLGHVALDDNHVYENGHFEMEDQLTGYHEDIAWKELERGAHHDHDGSMVLRLHDGDDPAVNSTSNGCIPTNPNGSLIMDDQDNVAAMPMMPSQMRFPFSCGENMILIPVQAVPCPQGETSVLADHTRTRKRNDQRKPSRGGSSSMPQKQSSMQDRSKDTRFKGHQPLAVQPQNLQVNQVMLPLRTQGLEQVVDQGHAATALPPLVMPTSGPIAFAQLPAGARLDESGPAFQVSANDLQIYPESMQHLLQTQLLQGQLVQTGQGPILLMPSIIPQPLPARPGPIATGLVKALHFEVLEFARWTRPSSEVQLHVEAAIDCVRKGVKTVWPDADLEVFGSFATGLCLQHSDVDLAVIDAPQLLGSENLSLAQASASLIRELAAGLRTFEWCESINALDTASMPVVKCLCRPFGASSSTIPAIAVDVTIGGIRSNGPSSPMESLDKAVRPGKFSTRHTGGAAREYVLQKIRELPALAPLVLLLKSFLHHKGLSNVYSGGLGSFSLTLLVAFFLERVPPIEGHVDMTTNDLPTSPSSSPLSCSSVFSDDSDALSSKSSFGASNSGSEWSGHQSLGECYVRRAASTIERVLSFLDRAGSAQLGVLLLGFLQTFGCEHDLSREKIVLKGPDGPGGFERRDDRHVALWIDDPLRPGVNIGAGSFGMVHVQNAFKEMLHVLLGSIPGLTPSPLHCAEKTCQDLAAMGQFQCLSRLIVGQAEDLP